MTKRSESATAGFACNPTGMEIGLVAAAVVLCLLPFAGKPYNFDDTLFLRCAEWIQQHPLDYYGFDTNWYGTVQPMHRITQNPPLTSFALAGAASLLGWSESAIHAAFLLPAVATGIGVLFLANGFCRRPVLAASISVLTPAFLVCGTGVMSDMMMVAFYVWAMFFWLRGEETGRTGSFLLSAVLVSLASLTKYFGITLVPLLFAYSVLERRRLRPQLLFLVLPVAVMALYQVQTQLMYGSGSFGNAAVYAIREGMAGKSQWVQKTVTGFSFTGGCLLPVLLHAITPGSKGRRWVWITGAVIAVVALILALLGGFFLPSMKTEEGMTWGRLAQLAVFSGAALFVMALALVDLRRNRDALSWLLSLWVAGTFLFAAFVNWTANGRSVLPLVPAAAILVVRGIYDRRKAAGPVSLVRAAALCVAAAVSLGVAWADFTLARCQKEAAEEIANRYREQPGTTWFQGHWGFQYYMEANDGKAVDFRNREQRSGDRLVVPLNNTNLRPVDPRRYRLTGRLERMPARGLTVMQAAAGAGFYSDLWGPLPYAVGSVEQETYLIFTVK